MLNDDFADRTLPPTERRRREARSRGQVARSRELTSAIALLLVAITFYFGFSASLRPLLGPLQSSLSSTPRFSLNAADATDLLQRAMMTAWGLVWPVMVVLLIAGIIANLAQTGWLWTPSSAAAGFRVGNVVSAKEGMKAFAKLVRFGVLAIVFLHFVLTHQSSLVTIQSVTPGSILLESGRLVLQLVLELSISLVCLGVADYGFQYWRHEQSLKMTAAERQLEEKDDAVDPRLKQAQREMVQRNQSSHNHADAGQSTEVGDR